MTGQTNTPRRVHLVGSGGTDYRQYMELAASTVGPHLKTLPNGEPRRPNWVVEFIEHDIATNPDTIVCRRSRLSEPRDLRMILDAPRVTTRPGRKLTSSMIPLPYATEAAESLPIFREVTAAHGLTEMRPQYSVPGPFDVAAMRRANPLSAYQAEADAALREIESIRGLHPVGTPQPVFQVELPVETVLVAKTPKRFQVATAGWMFRRVCQFIGTAPAGTEWVIHLCYANKNNSPSTSPRDCGPLVVSTETIVEYWPAGQILNAVHWPIGDARTPPPAKEAFWFPATGMMLSDAVHLSAGLARVGHPLGYLRGALHIAENTLGRALGVSTSCGQGRDPATLKDTMTLLAALAVD